MTEDDQKTLHHFEMRTRQLILLHKNAVNENRELREGIAQRDRCIEELQMQIEKLQNDYARLKTAKMIEISSEDTLAAQKRIAKMIREIDKCIAMLNI